MRNLLRGIGRILTLTGIINLAWLLVNWWTGKPIGQLQILGLLVLALGLTLLRIRPDEKPVKSNLSPSQREEEKRKHKSWIESGKN
ncbi:MAG: hypothetical protein GX415_01575 [Chloroflexi bacterium]|mgnify:FL=1|jgi:hypothetical protein|nr:hypothetical protein [Anaerolineaceae bacterium]NLI44098.1 hypothetical protein [Chloroflexota bacterium]HOE35161.1 hypothetical protein [Anaerolineaceae bacterium]HOT26287.1 hypothetical protein [Anaerolineaceae bacterium]HQK04265.1 hypothetical protein [Anaerolineaceae bacterium]